MFHNLVSSRTSDLSLEETLGIANKRVELARKEDDPAKALELSGDAELLMRDAEDIFTSTKAKDPVLHRDIANAYHEHGRLLDDLGYHDKAKKSHSKAEAWGYVDIVSHHAGISQGTIRQSLSSTADSSSAPSVATAMDQDSTKTDVVQLRHQEPTLHAVPAKTNNVKPTPSKGFMHIPQKIFDQNVIPPVFKYALPEPGERITSTPQLAYCLSLLSSSAISKGELDQNECDWLQARVDDPDEQERLQTMATDVIRAFVREELKKPSVVAEVVSLAAVLGEDDFRKLLQVFVNDINQSVLLDNHLLNGLAQLIENAPQEYIDAGDLVKILELLNTRLKDTHKQSTRNIYRLALAISQVLDGMVDSQIEGLSREQLRESLSDYLKGLQQSLDPYLIYQAAYAYQALQYIPDDETILQSMARRTGKVVQGISGVVSAVKALDLIGFIEGLQNAQQSLDGAEKAIGLINDTYSNVMALAENGRGLLAALKDLNFKHKDSWYPALRGLDRLVQEGRFADFEKLVREAPCQHNPAFRWGVCQRLGEIAANTIWDLKTRKCSVDFLIQLYNDDGNNEQQVAQWILYILNRLAESSKDVIESSALELLQEAQSNSISGKGIICHDFENDNLVSPSIMVTPPSMESQLLDCVQNIPDVETPLRQLKLERLKDRAGDIYISPRAKTTPRATDDFDLTSKVQEFLTSDKKVFLVLGDSGAGKSIFNRALEISLWENYKINGRIPLFIHLPAIEKPEQDLIAERLRKINFTESQILELKLHREFILICDGYDESQQTRNLYMSNQLNQPGQWRAQMVISCRTEYNGVEYKDCFQPIDQNNGRGTGRFQQATISPFTKEQIQGYIRQYVSLKRSQWGLESYLQALEQVPNLQDLVKNPFLLKISLEVLPQLLKTNTKLSSTHITRLQLYDEFVEQWIDRSKIRLTEMELNPYDRETFKQMMDFGFQEQGITYFKELVTAIYEYQNGNPVVNYSPRLDGKTWKEAFFSERDGSHLLREAIPLTRNGDQYRFIHKSLLEYGLSLAVFGPSKRNEEDIEATPSMPRRGSTSSILSFEVPSSTESAAAADDNSLLDSPLGKRNLVGERSVLQFLTERAQREAVFKDQLHFVIERSKSEKTARIAAANAITILVRAGVQFNSADLRNIQIPGADLSFGMFDSAQLEGADLRKADLQSIWMRQANLRGAQMKGAQFGELPFLKEDSEVYCSAYSPDGKIYAAGLGSGDISLYETSSWSRIGKLKGHYDIISSLSFSTTGNHIASGSFDSTVRLWDVGSSECVHILQGHSDRVWSVVYSPRGDRIASGSRDSSMRLWDVDTGECVYTLQGHRRGFKSFVFSPNGDRIASGGWDSTVRLWDADTGKCIHTMEGHSNYVLSVAYSPNGDQIASGSDDSTVRLWNIDTGECIQTLQGHSSYVRSVLYSPEGGRIVSGSEDKTIRLWDVDTSECIRILKGHSGSIESVVYSPRGDRVASGSRDSTVRLWDVDTGECVHTFQGHINFVVYSPKGDQITSGSPNNTARLWDVDIGECTHILQGHSGGVKSVVFSPKGDRIASGSLDNTVRLWDVDTGECVHTLRGHSFFINSVTYSPKGDRIASGSYDKTVRLWDADTGECIHTLQGHSGYVLNAVFSPKGDRIASGSHDKTVRLWDVDTGECVHTLQGHSSFVLSVMYSPKGDRIASGSDDMTVRLWDVDTGECVHTFQGHSSFVRNVAYSPKGDQIASGSEDFTVRLWNVDTGECVFVLQGHSHVVCSVVYSPKGDQVASGSEDKTVRLWNVETGECIHTLRDHSGCVSNVVFSPKGQITSISWDMTVKLWDVETGHCLVTIPCNGVSSVTWESNFESQYLVTGSHDKSVRRWRITKEEVEHRAVLCWSSSHEVLTVHDLSFDDAQDLSRMNQELLIQRGASVPIPLLSNRESVDKSNLAKH